MGIEPDAIDPYRQCREVSVCADVSTTGEHCIEMSYDAESFSDCRKQIDSFTFYEALRKEYVSMLHLYAFIENGGSLQVAKKWVPLTLYRNSRPRFCPTPVHNPNSRYGMPGARATRPGHPIARHVQKYRRELKEPSSSRRSSRTSTRRRRRSSSTERTGR